MNVQERNKIILALAKRRVADIENAISVRDDRVLEELCICGLLDWEELNANENESCD